MATRRIKHSTYSSFWLFQNSERRMSKIKRFKAIQDRFTTLTQVTDAIKREGLESCGLIFGMLLLFHTFLWKFANPRNKKWHLFLPDGAVQLNNMASRLIYWNRRRCLFVIGDMSHLITYHMSLWTYHIFIPDFFLRKKGIFISYQNRFVLRPSVTFLVSVSSPKPLDVETSNLLVDKSHWAIFLVNASSPNQLDVATSNFAGV